METRTPAREARTRATHTLRKQHNGIKKGDKLRRAVITYRDMQFYGYEEALKTIESAVIPTIPKASRSKIPIFPECNKLQASRYCTRVMLVPRRMVKREAS